MSNQEILIIMNIGLSITNLGIGLIIVSLLP